ncbi:MAG: GspE/PulE family protein [bacterium]|nr:GspE/PulE family protein [bacterium]
MAGFDLQEEQEKRLQEFRTREAEDLTRILARKYDLSYIDLSGITIDLDGLQILKEKDARRGQMAIFQKIGKKLRIAIKSPNLDGTKEVLSTLKDMGYSYELFLSSEHSLGRAWSRYKEVPEFLETKRGFIDISVERLQEFSEKIENIKTLRDTLDPMTHTTQQRKVSEILEAVVASALKLGASDIHVEPQEKEARLRLRLDGMLQDVVMLPFPVYKLLLSRVKLVSELKLNIHQKPQDGRFTIRPEERRDIEVRTSILPGAYGESIVMRILDPQTISIEVANLGMRPDLQIIVEDQLKKPNGMILTTGPTGSGKTTTLYAFIKKVYTPDVKVITIEDPIEYHVIGINQTQVDASKGYSFATGLRSILRQDPDVILVGEIRDLETANTAMHAALTGHQVFSTLHTNDAAGTIPRLIDLGVRPSIIAPAVNMSMAQRLIRKLCEACKKKDAPTPEEKAKITHAIETLPKGMARPDISSFSLYHPQGCNECNDTGYKGRIGIFEILLIDDEVERLILESPSHAKLRDEMKRQRIPNLFQDGMLKVIEGITSLEEVERAAGAK